MWMHRKFHDYMYSVGDLVQVLMISVNYSDNGEYNTSGRILEYGPYWETPASPQGPSYLALLEDRPGDTPYMTCLHEEVGGEGLYGLW